MPRPGSLPENLSTAEKTVWMAQLPWHLSWQALMVSGQPTISIRDALNKLMGWAELC